MAEWHELATMTSAEFGRAVQDIQLALVPVGATEQHGPNLALATDYVVAHRFAQKIAARLHPHAVVLPPMPFGLSYHHAAFPGTITLGPESFTAVCVDVARSLKRNGIRHLLFVNGHNGNLAILNVVTTKLVYEEGVQAATSFYFAQAADEVRKHAKSKRFGHACEIESSVLMHLAPDLVRKDALAPGEMLETQLTLAFNNEPFALQMPVPFHQQTRNGVFGDARQADPEIGRAIIERATERTLAFIEGFVRQSPPTVI